MKNIRWKTILPVCVLLLAVVLAGCSKAPAKAEETKPTVQAAPAETAPAQSGTEAPAVEPTVEPTVEPVEEPERSLKDEALAAYQQILNAAPALEGDHPELSDASFNYDQNLERFGKHCDMFALYDIDQDGIPELLTLSTVNFRWAPVSVYTYANGAAVLLQDPLEPTDHATFEQYSGANGAYVTYLCEAGHIHSVWLGTNPMGDAEEENHAYVLEGTTLTAVDCAVEDNENRLYFYDIARANTGAVNLADIANGVEETEITWVGTWYEEKLGMEMTVTENGNGYNFAVRWPDPENNMTYFWEINGNLNEGGVIYYSNGVTGVMEKAADSRETTTILSDHERGNMALLYDGTLLWIEEVEVEVEHSFVKY